MELQAPSYEHQSGSPRNNMAQPFSCMIHQSKKRYRLISVVFAHCIDIQICKQPLRKGTNKMRIMQGLSEKKRHYGVFSAFYPSFASRNPINMHLLYAIEHTFFVFLFIVLVSLSRYSFFTPYIFALHTLIIIRSYTVTPNSGSSTIALHTLIIIPSYTPHIPTYLYSYIPTLLIR